MKQAADQHRDGRIVHQQKIDRRAEVGKCKLNSVKQVGCEVKLDEGIHTEVGDRHEQEATCLDGITQRAWCGARASNTHESPKTLDMQSNMGKRDCEPPVRAQHVDSARKGGSRQGRQEAKGELRENKGARQLPSNAYDQSHNSNKAQRANRIGATSEEC